MRLKSILENLLRLPLEKRDVFVPAPDTHEPVAAKLVAIAKQSAIITSEFFNGSWLVALEDINVLRKK